MLPLLEQLVVQCRVDKGMDQGARRTSSAHGHLSLLCGRRLGWLGCRFVAHRFDPRDVIQVHEGGVREVGGPGKAMAMTQGACNWRERRQHVPHEPPELSGKKLNAVHPSRREQSRQQSSTLVAPSHGVLSGRNVQLFGAAGPAVRGRQGKRLVPRQQRLASTRPVRPLHPAEEQQGRKDASHCLSC
eukprot:3396795-Prymnesium_polylepis.2